MGQNKSVTSILGVLLNRKQSILLFFSNLFILILSFLVLSCDRVTTNKFQFCDNFNEPLDCTEPKTENDIVYLDQKLFKKEKPTYEDFGNFLYFTARETPGFRLVLSQPFNGMGKDAFRSGYAAYLQYGNSSERMEGNLFQNNVVVSFHYLGALLKEEFRHKGIEKSPFRLEDLGVISLEYKVMVPEMEPIIKQRTVELRWK
ncbi:hypothetical protein [Leptospira bandrabouensis]|uniref:hypothetical protein n=1 Tax=Leptospira bandrabouensis TaxID=2484903 RepID=UPI001EE84CE9|nr:hypothetical protein [Leptospira bandrabouensis]MCG6144622.1 hypothetical protein [Leptospira bandrabouensis]MCG6152637.1 hypothetical protein [Leptospira bandrabouensis]MCG6161826.1 hypothetical protein [Leptospira bandrabouensis]MCG6164673.1 hypothetical protein [Leptospira bandrabouensis]